MTNDANYKRGKIHHSPCHSDIRTLNQLNIQDPVWGENAGVGVCQSAAETMRIGQEKCSLTIQRTDNKVMKHLSEIPQSLSIENM